LRNLIGRTELLARDVSPLRSLDINPSDFYLWGKLRTVVYANNPHDLRVLKQNICETIYNIQQCEL
jgi:hypothetical protein